MSSEVIVSLEATMKALARELDELTAPRPESIKGRFSPEVILRHMMWGLIIWVPMLIIALASSSQLLKWTLLALTFVSFGITFYLVRGRWSIRSFSANADKGILKINDPPALRYLKFGSSPDVIVIGNLNFDTPTQTPWQALWRIENLQQIMQGSKRPVILLRGVRLKDIHKIRAIAEHRSNLSQSDTRALIGILQSMVQLLALMEQIKQQHSEIIAQNAEIIAQNARTNELLEEIAAQGRGHSAHAYTGSSVHRPPAPDAAIDEEGN